MDGLKYFEILRALSFEKYFGDVPINKDLLESAADLLRRVIGLLWDIEYDDFLIITSGYRDPDHNAKVGGARNSYHVRGKGIDLFDPELKLARRIEMEPHLLEKYELWMEDPETAKDHVHLDTGVRADRPVRIFRV